MSILNFENFSSIRDEYIKYGTADKYYQENSDKYKNPHFDIIKKCVNSLTKFIEFNSVLDLSCGGGEVTSELMKIGIMDITGSDPYTCNLYQKNTAKPCINMSFNDILKGKIDRKYDIIICSFALHLCEESKIPTLLYQLSLKCNWLVIISPNKRPYINDNLGFKLKEFYEIERVKVRIYKSENSAILETKSDIKSKNIKDIILNLKNIPKERKEEAISLLKAYTKAGSSRITGLNLAKSLKDKINKGNYPSGFDMGIDKNGYFIHTHRARSKSYEDPSKISVRDIKFIDSTG